jgi:hypothetical protein
MTVAKFKPFMFSVWGFTLSNIAYILIFTIVNDFCSSSAYRGPVCTSEDCQWYREPYFAGVAISVDRFLPQIPRWDKHVITDLISALWMVNLMLALNRCFE